MSLARGPFARLVRASGATLNRRGYVFHRDTHRARLLGWGLFFPMYAHILVLAKAPLWALAAIAFTSLIYPWCMTLWMLRARNSMRLLAASLVFEAAALAVFGEVACLHPLLVTVTFTVATINAGSVHGIKVSALALGTAIVTATALQGHLRAVPTVELSDPTAYGLGGYLLAYTLLVTHMVHSSVVGFIRARNEVKEQKRRLEGLHAHLLESIATPYVSEQEILGLIGSELGPEQAQQYGERLRSRQQLESLGRRAAIVSHDLRNLMQPVTMSAELLLEDLEGRHEDLELVEEIAGASRRAVEMLDLLVRSSASSSPRTRRCAPAPVIHEIVNLLASRVSGTATQVTFDDEVSDPASSVADNVHVTLDSDALHRVLMNLGVNAIQALDGAGNLRFQLRTLTEQEVFAVAPLPEHVAAHRAVVLAVRDDGPGIPAAIQEKIFEPYFTTRAGHGGTGLGLSTTFALIADAGGVLRVESHEGHGTTFRIVLPIVSDHAVASPVAGTVADVDGPHREATAGHSEVMRP